MPSIFKILKDYRRVTGLLVVGMAVLLLPYMAGATSVSAKKTSDVSKKAAPPKPTGTSTAKKQAPPAAKPETKKTVATAGKPASNAKQTTAPTKKITAPTAVNSAKSKAKKTETAQTASKAKKTASRSRVQTTVENDIPFRKEVQKYIGTPYVRGGTGSNGIDCSGLSKKFYAEVFGIELPHSSHDQSLLSALEQVPASVDSLQPSDLLFFSNTKKKTINHVGIYLSDGKFLHATPRGGVIISDLNETAYYRNHLVSSKRMKNTFLAKALTDSNDAGDDVLLSQNIGLGYSTPTQKPVSVKVETFYDRDLSAKDSGRGASGGSGMSVPTDVETWKGMRASADFHPVAGMRITPSVSVMDGETLASRDEQHWKAYGVEAAIAPKGSAWSMALSLHSLFNETYYEAYPGMESGTDMGLRFNYQVSDAIHFSVNSTWDNMGPREQKSATDVRELNQDISFNLGFSF